MSLLATCSSAARSPATAGALWTPAVRAALTPPEPLTVPQWAERNRYLAREQSSRPGPWRNAAAPYLIGIMLLLLRIGIRELTIRKCAQAGASEAIRNAIAYVADREPDPVLLVLPSEDVGRKIMRRRIWPLLRHTPCLKRLLTPNAHDVQLHTITLANGFVLALGWSGSPATLAADPQRFVINDEVDKFVEWSGREADPISLGRERTKTYEGRGKVVNNSTPTVRSGLITQRYEAAPVKLAYYCPCHNCGRYEVWSFDQLHWPDSGDIARLIRRSHAAWLVCPACGGQIVDAQRPKAVRAGVWATAAARQERSWDRLVAAAGPGGVVDADWWPEEQVAVQLSCFPVLWVHLWDVAGMYWASKDDPAKLMNFRNSWLGEPFEEQLTHTRGKFFAARTQAAPPAGLVPDWAQLLLATADVQRDYFYWVVRAWGWPRRSQRIAHGMAQGFDALQAVALDADYPTASGGRMGIHRLAIDAHYQTDTQDVYAFALRHINRVHPLHGSDKIQQPLRPLRVTQQKPGGAKSRTRQLWAHVWSNLHFKDLLAAEFERTVPDVDPATGEERATMPAWLLNDQQDPDYNKQMASEHKVLDRKGRGRPVERWLPVTTGAANHYWDCEVMQLVLSQIARVELLGPPRPAGPDPAPTEPTRGTPSGWKIGR